MAFVFAGKPHCVSQGIALKEVVRIVMLARNLHMDCRIRSPIEKQLRDLQPFVIELRSRVENGGLTPCTVMVHRCAGVHIGAAIEQKTGCLRVTILRGNVQQGPSCEGQPARRSPAKVQFREAAVQESGIASRCRATRSRRPRSRSNTAGTLYLVVAPALSKISMQVASSALLE